MPQFQIFIIKPNNTCINEYKCEMFRLHTSYGNFVVPDNAVSGSFAFCSVLKENDIEK